MEAIIAGIILAVLLVATCALIGAAGFIVLTALRIVRNMYRLLIGTR